VLLVFLGTQTVHAASSPADGNDHRELDEVIVTAQKRAERLLDVPLAISVLDGAALDGSSLLSATEALNTQPGVAASTGYQGGTTLLSVRGVAASGPLFSGSSPIAYYLDSSPFGFVNSALAPDFDAYDLQRIEVLRGPQGTLHGASAQNGVVRVLTNDADPGGFELKGRAMGSYTQGGSGDFRGDMAVNVPVVDDRLAARAVLGYTHLSGWVDGPVGNDVNDARLRTLRLKLAARPLDGLAIGVSAWNSHNEYGAPSASDDDGRISATLPQPISADTNVYGLTVDYTTAAVSMSGRTSYLDYGNSSIWDPTAAGVPGVTVSTRLASRVFAQELLVNSLPQAAWHWTAGVLYRRADDDLLQNFVWFPAPLDYSHGSNSWAVYGEAGKRFWGDRLEWTLGLRQFHDKVMSRENVQSQGLPEVPLYRANDSFQATTPRATLSWYPAADITVYGSYSEGFRSGFPQDAAIFHAAPDLPPVKPDRLENFEIGTHGMVGDRFSFDGAIYYIKWKDVQQSLSVRIGNIPEVANVNGESASGMGVDLGVTVRPLSGLVVAVGLSWNNLALDDVVTIPDGQLFDKGDRLNYSPEFSGNLMASYRLPLGGGYTGTFTAAGNYTSAQDYRGSNTGIAVNHGDAQLIARTSVALAAPAHWSIMLYVGNVTGEYGATPTLNLMPEWELRPRPRMLGLQYDYRF
jgi:outer membrane receptor protein involved in Fe transport